MKIKNFFLFLILSSLNLFSQNSTSSAFSFIGFGENIFKGNATNRVMGGLDVFTDSININLNNPTSYAKLNQKLLQLIIFQLQFLLNSLDLDLV